MTEAPPFGKSELSLLLHEVAPILISPRDSITTSTRSLGTERTTNSIRPWRKARKKTQRKDEKAAAALVKTKNLGAKAKARSDEAQSYSSNASLWWSLIKPIAE